MMKIIRWNVVIPVAVFVAAVIVFCVIFLDGMMKLAFIKIGQGVFGAKVDIVQVKTSFKDSSVSIKGIAVADKNDPWHNLFEIGELKAEITPSQLFYKKLVINEISSENMKFGTKRAVFGALPKKRKDRITEAEKKKQQAEFFADLQAKLEIPDIRELEKKLDVKKIIDPENMESVKRINEIREDYSKTSAKWEKSVDEIRNINLDDALGKISAVGDLKVRSVGDIPKIQEQIKQLNSARKEIEGVKNTLSQKDDDLKADVERIKVVLNEVESLKDMDYRALLSELNLDAFEVSNISRALFGDKLVGYAVKIKDMHSLLKKYMPPRKKSQKKLAVKRERQKGVDVVFPLDRAYPGFLLEKASASGVKEGMVLKGWIANVTSDPALLGKPAELYAGGTGDNGTSLKVEGVFDHTTENIDDILDIKYEAIIKDTVFKSGVYIDHQISRGRGSLNAKIHFQNDYWSIEFAGRAFALELKSNIQKTNQTQELVNEVLSGIKEVTLQGRIYEENNTIKSELKSNLDGIISSRIRAIAGRKVDEAKEKIKKEIDAVVNAKRDEILKDLRSKENLIKDILGSKEKLIRDKTGMVDEKIETGKSEIEGQGRQEAETLQRKGAEELKKRLGF